MVTLVVDNFDNYRNISQLFGKLDISEKIFIDCSQEPRIVAESIALECNKSNIRLIFINIESKCGGYRRQEQKGVEILMWLRCKHHVCNPIILYSFQSTSQLLNQKPENLIISSEGCYHFQLPYDFAKLAKHININRLSGVNDWDRIKDFLKPAFDISQFRHSHANWWGVKQLCKISYALDRSFSFDTNENEPFPHNYIKYYPKNINENLNILNNVVGSFLYDYSIEEVIDSTSETLKKKLQEETDIKKFKGKGQITTGQNIFRLYETLKANDIDFGIQPDDLTKTMVMQRIDKQNKDIQNLCSQLIDSINDRIKKLELLKEFKQGLDIEKIRDLSSKYNKKRILNSPRVLLIDDKAKEGWADIYQFIIFDKIIGNNFDILIPPNFSFDTDYLYSDIISQKVKEFCPDVILLDLRLFDEQDKSIEIDKISGKIILDHLKHDFPGIPIIMTTASNKIWSYESLMNIGAEGYWIKEGIDEQRDINASINNYYKLLDLIRNATGIRYKELMIFSEKVKSMFASHETEEFWWENHQWNFEYKVSVNGNFYTLIPNQTIVDRKIVKDILYDTISLIRQYYQSTIMGYGFNTYSEEKWYLASVAIQHLSNIVEVIHDTKTILKNYNYIRTNLKKKKLANNVNDLCGVRTFYGYDEKNEYRRKDQKASILYKERNEASHYEKVTNINIEKLDRFCQKILEYLMTPPTNPNLNLVERFERDGIVYDDPLYGNIVENSGK